MFYETFICKLGCLVNTLFFKTWFGFVNKRFLHELVSQKINILWQINTQRLLW